MTAATPEKPGWELYRSFLAVVRQGTLSGAARELGLTQPTIGRHVDALELALGIGLFARSPSGLKATSAALDLVPHAEAMATAAEALVRQATGQAEEEQGAVRVTASELVGVEAVTPALAAFRVLHPRISVELALSTRAEDLLRREADIAVRLFRPTQSALLAKRIGVLGMGLYAHPDYVARHGKPRDRGELTKHTLVGFDSEPWVRRNEAYGLPFSREAYAFRCDSYLGQNTAVRSGYGIGMYLHPAAKRDGLVRVLASAVEVPFEIWLAMHEDLRTHRRVRLLFEHLCEQLTTYVEGDTRGRGKRPAPR